MAAPEKKNWGLVLMDNYQTSEVGFGKKKKRLFLMRKDIYSVQICQVVGCPVHMGAVEV